MHAWKWWKIKLGQIHAESVLGQSSPSDRQERPCFDRWTERKKKTNKKKPKWSRKLFLWRRKIIPEMLNSSVLLLESSGFAQKTRNWNLRKKKKDSPKKKEKFDEDNSGFLWGFIWIRNYYRFDRVVTADKAEDDDSGGQGVKRWRKTHRRKWKEVKRELDQIFTKKRGRSSKKNKGSVTE